jgi:hypothetical protein
VERLYYNFYLNSNFTIIYNLYQTVMQVHSSVKEYLASIRKQDECNAEKWEGEGESCDCSSLMATDGYAFVWMRTEEGLVKGFYQGMVSGSLPLSSRS